MSEWTAKETERLTEIKNESSMYKWMHNRMAAKLLFIHKILDNVITFCNIIIASSLLTSYFYCGAEGWISIVMGIFAIFVAFLTRHHSNTNYFGQHKEQKYIAGRWSELYADIDEKMRIEDKPNGKDYLNFINTLNNNLTEIAPEIWSSVFKEYNKLNVPVQQADVNSNEYKKPSLALNNYHKYQLDRYHTDNIV